MYSKNQKQFRQLGSSRVIKMVPLDRPWTDPAPHIMRAASLSGNVKFRYVVFEIREWTDRRHADTLIAILWPSRGTSEVDLQNIR